MSCKTIEAAIDEVANTPQHDAGYLTDEMLEKHPAHADDPKFPPIRLEYRSAAMTVFQIVLTAMVGRRW